MKIWTFGLVVICSAILIGCGENPLCAEMRRAEMESVRTLLSSTNPLAAAMKGLEAKRLKDEISAKGISCKEVKQ